jgi:hypothetical protein
MTNVSKNAELQQSCITAVMPCFSLEDVLGIYVFVQKQREFIIDKREKSSLPTERLSLTFTANVLVDIMDEIHSLVDLRENKA